MMTKSSLQCFLLFFLLLPACSPTAQPTGPQVTVAANGVPHIFSVEIADTPDERAQGLMFRRRLEKDTGMLFIWPADAEDSFWMKNTPISLDILFIDKSGQIVFIAPSTTPYSTAPISPGISFRYVLEVGAGFVEKNGVRTGNHVVINHAGNQAQ